MDTDHKPKPIRDPIFNYIETTAVEQSVIDRPEFQRLRYILQNASVHLTYPGSCNSRFVHSLGVMVLSGKMFTRAIENSKDEVVAKFIKKLSAAVAVFEGRIQLSRADMIKNWMSVLGNAAHINYHLTLNNTNGHGKKSYDGKRTKKDESLADVIEHLYLINVVWQALRLAALVHDLGHFPLSHLFEYAIHDLITITKTEADELDADLNIRRQNFLDIIEAEIKQEFTDLDERGAIAIHEAIGIQVFQSFLPQDNPDSGFRDFCRLVYAISKYILILGWSQIPDPAKPKLVPGKYSSLRCLHGIVAGELDADRLEYCVRDPAVSGLELGAIDVERIVDSMILHEENDDFEILPTAKALSAVDAFFHQRYLIYKYMIYHHNVVRTDGIAREIVWRLLREAIYPMDQDTKLSQRLHELGLWSTQTRDYRFLPTDRFAHFDDAWLRTVMSESYFLLNDFGDKLSAKMEILRMLLDTYLHRVSGNIYSLWKRDCDYFKEMDEIGTRAKLNRVQLGEKLETNFQQEVYPLKNHLEEEFNTVLIFRLLRPKVLREKKDNLKQLKIVVQNDNAPWETKDATQISPYLDSLGKIAAESPRLHFSFVSESIKKNKELIDACRSRTLDLIEKWICKSTKRKNRNSSIRAGRKS